MKLSSLEGKTIRRFDGAMLDGFWTIEFTDGTSIKIQAGEGSVEGVLFLNGEEPDYD